jgi:hypothetical protein
MANFVINSSKRLKEKLEMIDSLSEIEIATKILSECDDDHDEIDTLNSHYKKLNCEIKSMDKTVSLINFSCFCFNCLLRFLFLGFFNLNSLKKLKIYLCIHYENFESNSLI